MFNSLSELISSNTFSFTTLCESLLVDLLLKVYSGIYPSADAFADCFTVVPTEFFILLKKKSMRVFSICLAILGLTEVHFQRKMIRVRLGSLKLHRK